MFLCPSETRLSTAISFLTFRLVQSLSASESGTSHVLSSDKKLLVQDLASVVLTGLTLDRDMVGTHRDMDTFLHNSTES